MTSLPNNLHQWLAFIEASHPSEIDLGLERVAAVAALLQLTPPRVVTVAGTNGKGSTVALMRAVAVAHGLRVGCYSSPHFIRYNERVSIDGSLVDDDSLCDAFVVVEQARQQAKVSLTYFEYGTLAALWLFSQQSLDLWLLEVGLGGRLDAVNLVDADVAVVTTVALDHQDWLGSDRDKIGYEKAGIARPARPLIFGDADLPASVSSYAADLGAPLLRWGIEFGPAAEPQESWCWRGLSADGTSLTLSDLPVPQLPFANASTALQALASAGVQLLPAEVREGLQGVSLTGRMQCMWRDGRELVLDVAHNPHAAGYLAAQLPPCDGTTWCVAAMLGDKDVESTLAALRPRIDRWRVASLGCPRGEKAGRLLAALEGADAESLESVAAALDSALAESAVGDRILVMGSFYTVAAALDALQE
ncbi:bifunctional tetrahydrofolate synthase/dihydrofolate synthase [Motiliproteus sediminis]|uniref:bifunctional tetrahydrofolate synthase/dihydrofolate synthase n=1 Tax=Motiliproteus sediminis TaxID=1468178 RepID=UPI001AF01E65|nr:bifunctional tetrahydrofolate synthase/dihydrofolate synthase [Motiliproteus sediminis]